MHFLHHFVHQVPEMTLNEASGTHFQRSAKASLLCPAWRQVNKSCTSAKPHTETTSLNSFGLVKTVGSMFAAPKNSKTCIKICQNHQNPGIFKIFQEPTCNFNSELCLIAFLRSNRWTFAWIQHTAGTMACNGWRSLSFGWKLHTSPRISLQWSI